MYCPNCGSDLNNDAKFCPNCGAPLHASPPMRSVQPSAPMRNEYRAPISQRGIAVSIILSIVTCGIYSLYWLYCIVTDLNIAVGEQDDTSGGMVVLLSLVTCNIYSLYWYYTAGRKVNTLNILRGRQEDSSLGILYLLLSLFGFGIVSMALIQNELNNVADL